MKPFRNTASATVNIAQHASKLGELYHDFTLNHPSKPIPHNPENVKSWNQLDTLKGEAELRHHLSNIIEYTFYFHKQKITEQEVEQLIHLLEKGGT